jgi:hypothetical protein
MYNTNVTAGMYASEKPGEEPCDAAFPCAGHQSLSLGAKIAIGVLVPTAGLAIILVPAVWILRKKKNMRHGTSALGVYFSDTISCGR